MSIQVTVAGPGGTSITIAPTSATSSAGGFAVAQIAYALSTISGTSYNVPPSVGAGQNVTLAAPTLTGGNTTAVAVVSVGGGGVVSVPSGYSAIILLGTSTVPETVVGANVTIITNQSGGTYNLTGNSTVAAGGGNNTINASGTYSVALAGTGNNNIVVTGSGTITGGTGTNTIIATDPPAVGNVINSVGTNDVIVPFGLATVTASGQNAAIWSSTVPTASSNNQLITVSGTGDSVVAGAVSDTITASGTNDVVFGDFTAIPTPMVVSIGGSGAGAGSNAEVAIYNSNATVNVGASASDVVLFGNYGTTQSSLIATLNGANGIVVDANSNVTVTTGVAAPTQIFGGFSSTAGALNVTDNNTVSSGGGFGTVIDVGYSTATVDTNGQHALVFGSFTAPTSPLTVNDGGSANTVDAGLSNLVFNSTGSKGLIFGSFSTATTVQATLAGNANIVDAGNSALTVTEQAGASNNTIYGGFSGSAAPLTVSDSGNKNTIAVGNSAANVSIAGTAGIVYGNFSAATGLSVDVSGGDTNGFTDNYIVTGESSASVTASSGTAYLDVVGGSGTLSFLATARNTTSTIFGGSGNTNVSVGAGSVQVAAGTGLTTVTSGFGVAASIASVVTLFGSAGSDVTFLGSAGGALYYAGAGNETLNAAGASASVTLWGGSGAESLSGGSGNDTLIAGSGAETMSGGAGTNTFLFLQVATTGNAVADVINNFSSGSNTLELFGYGVGAAAYKSIATVSGGATVLTLSDNTTIKFTGVTDTSVITSHILAG